jgi:hypothetical protein
MLVFISKIFGTLFSTVFDLYDYCNILKIGKNGGKRVSKTFGMHPIFLHSQGKHLEHLIW